MDFKLTKDERNTLALLSAFCLKEVKPLAPALDQEERFPLETVKKLAGMGIMGIAMPVEYGGKGQSYLSYILAVEELSKHCASTGTTLSAHSSLCAAPIEEFGTQAQKQKYLIPLAKGEHLGAFGLTESSAGTDAAQQKTTARDEGDHWLISGTKTFITNGYYADTYVIFAMTDQTQKTKGISAFIIEKGTPGFTFGSKEKKMGIRASSTYELVFDECKIPKENLLGAVGQGFQIAMHTLDGGRIGIAAQALGIAQGAIDELIPILKQQKDVSQKWRSASQNVQFAVADMQTKTDAARLLVYRAATAKQNGEPYSHLAAMAKLYASQAANEVTGKAVSICGEYCYTKDYPFERMMRDAKITEIYEGTSEVQKMVISHHLGVR